MQPEELDAAIGRWLVGKPEHLKCSYHIQVKIPSSEVEIAQLTAANLTGWVIIDWLHRGRGLSAKRAAPASHAPEIAQLLRGIGAERLHAQFQVVLAPDADWPGAYLPNTLAPDLMPVLDAGHTVVLSVAAERELGEWYVVHAHEPPNDEPISGL